jgi:hypothetical protein
MDLADPWLWVAAVLAAVAAILAAKLRRTRAALHAEAARCTALAAAQRASLERTAASLASAATGLLGNVSAVTSTSAQAVESVRATAETMTHLTHTAMATVVSAETVIGLAQQVRSALTEVERALEAAPEAQADAEADPEGLRAGSTIVHRTRGAIQRLSAKLHDSAGAARHIATVAQQQEAKFGEVMHAMDSIDLATEKSLESTEQVAREARSLDELASTLRRAASVPSA